MQGFFTWVGDEGGQQTREEGGAEGDSHGEHVMERFPSVHSGLGNSSTASLYVSASCTLYQVLNLLIQFSALLTFFCWSLFTRRLFGTHSTPTLPLNILFSIPHLSLPLVMPPSPPSATCRPERRALCCLSLVLLYGTCSVFSVSCVAVRVAQQGGVPLL